jgi:hypothetical protein
MYNIINEVLRQLVGSEQPLRSEIINIQSPINQNISDTDRCPEIIIRKSKSTKQAIRWATATDYEPRCTPSFHIKDFHESHAIRKWALENIYEKTSFAIEKANLLGFKRSSEFLSDYLKEKKSYYKNEIN